MIDVAAHDWRTLAAQLVADSRLFLDGERVEALTDARFTVENAFTGSAIASVPDCGAADLDRAVRSARTSFEAGVWSEMPAVERGRILHRMADLVGADATLALLDTVEMGMPIAISTTDKTEAAGLLRNCAELADQLSNVLIPGASTALSMEIRRPQGVVGVISPWNFPIGVALTMVAPALAAGNSVVLKPSEVAPLGCLRLAELAIAAGVPAGVFNVVTGLGPSTGKLLGLHPDIDLLSFTGSTATGQLLLQYSGQSNMKALLLECGGKSPQIVFDDMGDIEALADALVQGFTFNSGQVCTSGSRILVAASLYDRLMPLLVDRVRKSRTGDPLDPATLLGPLASRGQAGKVGHVLASIGDAGRLLARGETSGAEGSEIAPHLFETDDVATPLVQDEIFGPITVAMPFRDEDEAVRLTNATRYGLSATIWSSDLKVVQRMLPRLRVGVVLGYGVPTPSPTGIRFISCEPFKMSGFGAHGGAAGLATYTRIQAAILMLG